VLAANGIGTPRFLLNSANAQAPHGLANEHDQVGRNLMLHGYVLADIWYDQPTGHFMGPWGASTFSHEFHATDAMRGAVNGMTLTFGAGFGPAAVSLGGTTGIAPVAWGQAHHAEFARAFDHNVFAALQIEDLPQSDNRITLDPDVVDSSGIPAARRHYRLHENDRTLLEFGTQRLQEFATASGARSIDVQPVDDRYNPPGWHLMGTARMGARPESSVVDSWHRAWNVPGLVICDGSSMTTGGAVNPTSTIGAMALRCADGLIASMRSGLAVAADPAPAGRA
jgi:choline dehydrogenase-like flavoprotein